MRSVYVVPLVRPHFVPMPMLNWLVQGGGRATAGAVTEHAVQPLAHRCPLLLCQARYHRRSDRTASAILGRSTSRTATWKGQEPRLTILSHLQRSPQTCPRQPAGDVGSQSVQ